jgi:hypothetical protein
MVVPGRRSGSGDLVELPGQEGALGVLSHGGGPFRGTWFGYPYVGRAARIRRATGENNRAAGAAEP